MNGEIEVRLKKILEQSEGFSFLVDQYDLDVDINTLGVNSLIFIQLIVSIENEFEIEFDDDDLDIDQLSTFRDFIDHIELLLKVCGTAGTGF